MRKILASTVLMITLASCTNTPIVTEKTSETAIKDDKLAGFLLGGVYFFHGYGGANLVYEMVKAGTNHEPKTKEFLEELDKNYCEYMIFPFDVDQAVSSKKTLEDVWQIKDKTMFMQTLDYLKKSGHQNEFIIYKKMIDENGGANADMRKAAINKDEEVTKKLDFIQKNYAAISKTGIKAWDYARYVNNVCLGYSAGYIDKKEGEKLIADILVDARALYTNWQAYYDDYNMGLKYGGDEKENEKRFAITSKEMMTGDYSIYNYLSLR